MCWRQTQKVAEMAEIEVEMKLTESWVCLLKFTVCAIAIAVILD